jgi:NADPH:quinone reductase-like Zn-dependent oxidoreductase
MDAFWAAWLVAEHNRKGVLWLAVHRCSDLVSDDSTVLLWGTSFGGGHALTTAAKLKGNITAVVAQVGG